MDQNAYDAGWREGAAVAVAELETRRAGQYRDGIARDGAAICGAHEEGVTIGGVPVICMRPAGHALGPLDRHKAVFGEPHVCVSWNDRSEEYRSPMADPDSYREQG